MRKSQKSIRRCAAVLALAPLLAIASCATKPQLNAGTPHLQASDARIAADCASGRFSGVVAVYRQGRPIYFRHCGYADAARTMPLDPSANFKIFSSSKIFTAAAVASLVRDGRMSLEDSVRKYVPAAPANWQNVTVKHLLQHQSGIPDFTEKLLETYISGGARTHQQAIGSVLTSLSDAEKQLAAPPGSKWHYSNFGYELVARAAEAADGRPFHEVLKRRVIRPAGMKSTVVELPATFGPEPAAAIDPKLVGGFNGSSETWMPARSYSFVQQGAGALHAGYRDLLAFDRALSNNKIAGWQRQNEADSVPISDTVGYGYGWMIRRVGTCTYWQHSGGTNGYTSEFARAPQHGYAVIILSNLGFAHVDDLRRELMTALLRQSGCAG